MRFLTAIIIIAAIAGITALEVNLDGDKESKCANEKMDKCNKEVKKAFLKGGKKNLSPREIYCSSMKELSKCIAPQLKKENLCNSNKLRKYHFVVMAYLRMDKLMSVCTEDMKNTFKEKVMAQFLLVPEFQDFEEFRTLAFGEQPANVSPKAKIFHDKCIRLFTEHEASQNQDNLCDGVTKFIKCYQGEDRPTDPLSGAFADLINKMSTELIDAFKAHGSMCTVDPET